MASLPFGSVLQAIGLPPLDGHATSPGSARTQRVARSDALQRDRTERPFLPHETARAQRAGGARGCGEVGENEAVERSFCSSSAGARTKWGDRLVEERPSTSPELAMIRQTMSSKSASS